MYQYEHGVKKKNVGYARIESRNGQCKFTLHMQLLGQIDSIFPTYLIRRDGKELDLIYLGDSPLKSQMLDSRIMAEADNLVDSGHGISDIGGMIIFLNNDLFYATEWDDKPIIASEVLAALKPKKKPLPLEKQQEKPIQKSSKETSEVKTSKEQSDNTSATQKEEEQSDKRMIEVIYKATEEESRTIKEQDDLYDLVGNSGEHILDDGLTQAQIEDKIPKYKLPRGYKTLEGIQRDHYIFVESAKKDLEDIESGRSDMLTAATIKEAIKEKSTKKIADKINVKSDATAEGKAIVNPEVKSVVEEMVDKEVKPEEEVMVDTEVKPVEIGIVSPEVKPEEEVVVNPDADQLQKKVENTVEKREMVKSHSGKVTISQLTTDREPLPEDKKENKMVNYFFDKYPKMYPFEDSEVTLCVKIEPKDIGFLPNEFWSLSNNSFLLHGYYSHRHLIFAQINSQKGIRNILGIPGTFNGKERHMAKMFGFENFKSVRKRELKQGDFGYWCKYIQV